VSFIGGGVLAAPFVLYQVWRFIAPGLYAKEKRFAIPFVVLTTLGTVGGAAFSHYVLFPSTMAFFGQFGASAIKFMPRLEDTFELYKKLMLGMVLVFQIPTIVFFLAKMRPRHGRTAVAPSEVRRARQLRRGRGADLLGGSVEPDRLRDPDDRPLPAQHRHRMGSWT